MLTVNVIKNIKNKYINIKDIHFKLGMLAVNVIYYFYIFFRIYKNQYLNIKDIHFKLGMLTVNVIKNI